MQQLEQQLTAMAIRAQIIEAVVFLVAMFVLYLVIKAAVRDGIKDSGIVEAIRSLRTPVEETKLPPMRADR
ncbi:MAG: hypothetical protein U1E12_03375 [Hydrogenophaga sp.]|uniref:hypothetical protein n=1 Tax=Hydrogenophaga sp. TaxID=1904254 RepID=UPI002ABBE243|nr:hypothetical protein [Hydrogenophaga sp.]MDZ4100700.1 hypothetical protein [Hydrogenophaga sp.]